MADNTLTLRMATRPNEQGGTAFFPIVDGKIADKPIESTTLDDALTTSPAGFTTDGRRCTGSTAAAATPPRSMARMSPPAKRR